MIFYIQIYPPKAAVLSCNNQSQNCALHKTPHTLANFQSLPKFFLILTPVPPLHNPHPRSPSPKERGAARSFFNPHPRSPSPKERGAARSFFLILTPVPPLQKRGGQRAVVRGRGDWQIALTKQNFTLSASEP